MSGRPRRNDLAAAIERGRILVAYLFGEKDVVIAQRHNVTVTTPRTLARRAGLPPRSQNSYKRRLSA